MTDFLDKDALEYHQNGRKGKIAIRSTKPCITQMDLSLAYTPGVAAPCRAIAENEEDVYQYTARGNLVAVVSNGSAVLGLGNIGPKASKPVMEGKAVLFKRFADIDVFDIELDAPTADEIVAAVKAMAPTFGGINLEDIKAPECFEVEERLSKELDIPVFHDDQHGTAIICCAALMNALELAGKKMSNVTIVLSGTGAAGIAITKLMLSLGADKERILLCDSKGVIYKGREKGMSALKEQFAIETDKRNLAEALVGADVFIGVSVGGCVTQEMVKSMASNPIVFALANPDPEISYTDIMGAREDAIAATGRSDTPNQVNNVLGFPFIFRGALDVFASGINEEMKHAAVKALAKLTREPVPDSVLRAYNMEALSFSRDYIIPTPFDPRVLTWVAPAVAEAAVKSGVAQIKTTFDVDEYREHLNTLLGPIQNFMQLFINRARSARPTLVFPEGVSDRILKASNIITQEGIAQCVLLGDEQQIREKAESLYLPLDNICLLNPLKDEHYSKYADELYAERQRKGMTRTSAHDMLKSRRHYGLMMLKNNVVNGYLGGVTRAYADTALPVLQMIGLKEGVKAATGLYIIFCDDSPVLFADAAVNIDPNPEQLAQIAISSAEMAQMLGMEPRVAMLSFSNFGSNNHPHCRKMKEATQIAQQLRPDLNIDGEMQADTAVDPWLADNIFDFSSLGGKANVLIFPDLNSGNISYKLMQRLGGHEAIGPILLGTAKPINVIHRGSTVNEIVNLAALTAVMASRG